VLLHEEASLKLLREFRNEVERWQWRGVAFSNDDEHIVGASNGKNEHIMYVWNAVVGNLERILEGMPAHSLTQSLTHPPIRPLSQSPFHSLFSSLPCLLTHVLVLTLDLLENIDAWKLNLELSCMG